MMMTSNQETTKMVQVVGRVLSERHVANMKREITLLADDIDDDSASNSNSRQHKEYSIRLHAEEDDGVVMWMTLKRARQLLCVGVRLKVMGRIAVLDGEAEADDKDESVAIKNPPPNTPQHVKKQVVVVDASSIQVISVLPTKTYLATLLSFSDKDLQTLFPNNDNSGDPSDHDTQMFSFANKNKNTSSLLPPGVLAACCTATVSPAQLESVAAFCRAERGAGRTDKLWKAKPVADLTQALREHHEAHGTLLTTEYYCDCDPNNSNKNAKKHGQLPKVSKRTWQSLHRLEDRWLCPERDGAIGDYEFDMSSQSYRTIAAATTERKDGDSTTATGETPSPQQQQSMPSPAPSSSSELQKKSLTGSSSMVEHAQNIPDQQDERRVRYIDERKRPQVRCMLQLIHQLLLLKRSPAPIPTTDSSAPASDKNINNNEQQSLYVVEIGGGRGYLAHEVAAFYENRSGCSSVHVTVVDNNESSLSAGQRQAAQAGLLDYMSFVLCDLTDEIQVQNQLLNRDSATDLVLGLHCCGGLSEAAVELAIKSRASFCISTCCFRSIPKLASLSRLAVKIWAREEAANTMSQAPTLQSAICCQAKEEGHEQYQQKINVDMARVASLAVTVGASGMHRAIRACNAIRLFAAQQRFAKTGHPGVLRVWQESFPVEYSVQNRVLMGLVQ